MSVLVSIEQLQMKMAIEQSFIRWNAINHKILTLISVNKCFLLCI